MSSKPFKHYGVICKVCKNMPIGTRWKCAECVDFDLCSSCHDQLDNRHGHKFWRIQSQQFLKKMIFQKSIKTKHPVICDECRCFPIVGIRWRCMQCIDFDLCSKCYHDGKHDTLGHRFFCTTSATERWTFDKNGVRHHGVRCRNCLLSPIIGTRWKCSQCADYDLCPSCYNLGPDQHQHRHRFWRIEFPQNLTPIITNLQKRHTVNCSVCNRYPILGIRWNCNKCVDFNLCSDCYHDNKPTSFGSFGHRFWCIYDHFQTLLGPNLSLEPESGPSENIVVRNSEASFADNDTPIATTSRRTIKQNHMTDHDFERIESTNSNNRNASQASTDTNLVCVGSRVKIELDLETVQLLQQASGCNYSCESLKDYAEGIGTVTRINENGNVVVRYAHIGRSLTCNPVVLAKFAGQSGPPENIAVYNLEALFADNDSLASTKSGPNHITNIDENDDNRNASAKNCEVAQYKVQLTKMQQELEKMKDQVTCPICIEARKNIIFQCGHGVCNECNDRLRDFSCPICRKRIQQRIPFY